MNEHKLGFLIIIWLRHVLNICKILRWWVNIQLIFNIKQIQHWYYVSHFHSYRVVLTVTCWWFYVKPRQYNNDLNSNILKQWDETWLYSWECNMTKGCSAPIIFIACFFFLMMQNCILPYGSGSNVQRM